MPALNWDIFARLPGSAEKNFELLCRGIVRQNFGSFGVFRGLANQPGVEFHLKLDRRCDALGDPDRWWGWQCKWYDLASNSRLGATRRREIQEGLRKTEEHLPGLTDWALWTRRTLTKGDQDWFSRLSSKVKLHLWTGDEVDYYLTGQAVILRSTFFGELVLTPDILRERHERSVAPIRARWQPDVHHVGDAERDLRRMLGESESWDVLRALSTELRENAQKVELAPPVPSLLAPFVTDTISASKQSADALDSIAEGIRSGDLDLLRDELSARPRTLAESVATAPRKLRSGNQLAGLYTTNAVAGCLDTVRVLGNVEDAFSSRVVAVLASAGCGKTHLAAQLTTGTAARPHGVLLHGRDLHATHTLDDLVRRVSIAAEPVPSMESLLAAVDAAGQRARHRLPVIIDGLNESEDPRAWKPLLASLEKTLSKYPYVLLVCTLRPEYVNDALPDGTSRVELNDYGEETIEAARQHFHFWKIEATDASLPAFLRHPLTLRLFCEVTNPTRQEVVGVNAMPGSLTALFERYLEQVGVRVAELAPRTHRFYGHDVNAAISTIANKLWESRIRSIEYGELRSILGDSQRPWDQSLVRALEHEGVLLRMPSNGADAFVPVYDLLGGHIIAKELLAKHGRSDFEAWILESSTTTLLGGDYSVRHPLANDVLCSLVEQIPRRFHAEQLWQLVDEPLRGRALRLAAFLEPAFLDAATVEALLALASEADADLLDRLWTVRGMQGHPLNADALDRALRTMAVANRDLRWTEWLRKNQDEVVARGGSVLRDLKCLEQRWRTGQVRTGDQLRARWVMWTLTSTVRQLRDQATRTLYWFGRIDPEGLFALTIDSLGVNDAYVSERMLAASYGIAMSHQNADIEFGVLLKPFLAQLAVALIGASASAPTHHYLARLYVRGIVAFTEKFYTSALPDRLRSAWSFGTPAPVSPIATSDPRAEEVGRTLRMDFENYTLGRLFEDRDTYDVNHHGHQSAVAHVRGVVWSLGWRAATLEAVDQSIEQDAFRSEIRGDLPRAERYGKKYGWIGFFTYAGLLEARGLFPRRDWPFSEFDIDPSFPEPPPVDGEAGVSSAWLLPSVESHERWIRECTTSVPRSLIIREKIGNHKGPWVAVHGFIKAEDRFVGREAWAFISALVTPKQSAPRLVSALSAGEQPRVARNTPSGLYTFAGEIPWRPNFAALALMESAPEQAHREQVHIANENVEIETLAHDYRWEGYGSEMIRTGSAQVPSRSFSDRFNLWSAPQGFDQLLPDGTKATITLRGVDGLEGDILYIREDLLRQYVGGRTIVWSAVGARQLLAAHNSSAWHAVLTEAELTPQKTTKAANGGKGRQTVTQRPATKATGKNARRTRAPTNTAAKKKSATKRPPARGAS